MCIVFSFIAFMYAYVSYQDNNMISFYLSLLVGTVFVGLMLNNIQKARKERKK